MSKQCYIATGSDFAKTKEQVPWDVLDCFEYTFCCMGNEVRDKMGAAVYKSDFIIPDSLDMDLRNFLEEITEAERHFRKKGLRNLKAS